MTECFSSEFQNIKKYTNVKKKSENGEKNPIKFVKLAFLQIQPNTQHSAHAYANLGVSEQTTWDTEENDILECVCAKDVAGILCESNHAGYCRNKWFNLNFELYSEWNLNLHMQQSRVAGSGHKKALEAPQPSSELYRLVHF